VRWVDARHALIEPIPGMTPASLHAGDRLDLTAQSRATRIALVGSESILLPGSARYPLMIERGSGQVRVVVHTVDINNGGFANWNDWLSVYGTVLYTFITLLALWRGHDRAALGMALWAVGGPFVGALSIFHPGDDSVVLVSTSAAFRRAVQRLISSSITMLTVSPPHGNT
jgi:hypothetical protein